MGKAAAKSGEADHRRRLFEKYAKNLTWYAPPLPS